MKNVKIFTFIAVALAFAIAATISRRDRLTALGRTVINRVAHPGYGCCDRCKRTWDVVQGHNTFFSFSTLTDTDIFLVGRTMTMWPGWKCVGATNGYESVPLWQMTNHGWSAEQVSAAKKPKPEWGCFPLCEDCWHSLTPSERLPYYEKMFGDRRGDRGDHHTESDWLSMSNEVMKGN